MARRVISRPQRQAPTGLKGHAKTLGKRQRQEVAESDGDEDDRNAARQLRDEAQHGQSAAERPAVHDFTTILGAALKRPRENDVATEPTLIDGDHAQSPRPGATPARRPANDQDDSPDAGPSKHALARAASPKAKLSVPPDRVQVSIVRTKRTGNGKSSNGLSAQGNAVDDPPVPTQLKKTRSGQMAPNESVNARPNSRTEKQQPQKVRKDRSGESPPKSIKNTGKTPASASRASESEHDEVEDEEADADEDDEVKDNGVGATRGTKKVNDVDDQEILISSDSSTKCTRRELKELKWRHAIAHDVASKGLWWSGSYRFLREAQFHAWVISKEYSGGGDNARMICTDIKDIRAQLRSLPTATCIPHATVSKLHDLDRKIDEHLGTLPIITTLEPLERNRAMKDVVIVVSRLARLLFRLLPEWPSLEGLSSTQLQAIVTIARRIDEYKTRSKGVNGRSRNLVTVFARTSRALKHLTPELRKLQNREIVAAMASEPDPRLEFERQVAENDAREASLRAWRRQWLALHVDRREAETANFTRLLPKGKADLLRDVLVDSVARPAEQPWVRAWKAQQARRQRRQRQVQSSRTTSALPRTPSPGAPLPELDANGVPLERVEGLTPRRTPRPRNPLSPAADTQDGLADWTDEAVTRAHRDEAARYTGRAFSSAQDDALLDALSRFSSAPFSSSSFSVSSGADPSTPTTSLWRDVIWATTEPGRDPRTGAWSDAPLVGFTVCEIVARAIWWRDLLWLDPERREKGLPLESWVTGIWDPRVVPAAAVAGEEEEDEE